MGLGFESPLTTLHHGNKDSDKSKGFGITLPEVTTLMTTLMKTKLPSPFCRSTPRCDASSCVDAG
ncbi:unnamed protein product [Lathyrus oleraceus]